MKTTTLDNFNNILACGEDSSHQFKRDFSNAEALAAELIAFANTIGGVLVIGVDDTGCITGLSPERVGSLNQLLANVASQNVRPPINPLSQNVATEHGLVMVVEVSQGNNKPYMDLQGRIWVKSGADKRQVTAREEMQRLFQESGLVYADEVPIGSGGLDDLDLTAFGEYFARRYRKSVSAVNVPLAKLLNNLNLAKDGVPNLTGWLLFSRYPQSQKPAFIVKAVAFPGTVLHDRHYLDSEDLEGTLPELYQRSIAFIKRNLRHVQGGQSFNSPGKLEVPEDVFEELLVNALVHRDYFIIAPIRLLIFADRVEIISPGHLPNHLDVEQIRYGLSNLRNPALASHAFHLLPYRGLGSGIPRATEAWPDIDLIDDQRGNQFRVIVMRPAIKDRTIKAESQAESQAESLKERIVAALHTGPLSKSEIAAALGMRGVTGHLNLGIRKLLAEGSISMTRPESPNSRLQKYRLKGNFEL